MDELMQQGEDAARGSTPAIAARRSGDGRRLCVMRAGTRLFAVYADEVEATSENLRPTPLPFAPAPVRGVVSQRGRILTVIDPLPLLPSLAPSTAAANADAPPPSSHTPQPHAPLIVALRGDEQLALSVERIEHEIKLCDDEADEPRNPSPGTQLLLRRTIQHHTGAIALLDPAHLFEAAMQGVERRRRRQ